MVSKAMVSTKARMTSSLNASTCTTMKLAQINTFLVRSLLTSSPALWSTFVLVHWAVYSARTTLSSAKVVLVTTGQKDVRKCFFDAFSRNYFDGWTLMVLSVTDYTEGAELVDSVLDVVRKEAEGTDGLQGPCGRQ